MHIGKSIFVFFAGIVLSVTAGVVFNDGGMASAVAICFIGAVICGQLYKKD